MRHETQDREDGETGEEARQRVTSAQRQCVFVTIVRERVVTSQRWNQ